MTGSPPLLDRVALWLQLAIDRLFFPLMLMLAVSYVRLIYRYRFAGHDAARRVHAEAVRRRRPTIVCANHLTLSDSVLLHYALASPLSMLVNFRRVSWNVPEATNFKTAALRLVTYLVKCVPIQRAGSREHKRRVLARLRWLLDRGEVITIFPEGTRSRSGRLDVDNLTYGVGELLAGLPDAQVVCVYLRGTRQETFSDVPARGDTLEVTAEILEPRAPTTDKRGARELTRQIGARLKMMEEAYFARARTGLIRGGP